MIISSGANNCGTHAFVKNNYFLMRNYIFSELILQLKVVTYVTYFFSVILSKFTKWLLFYNPIYSSLLGVPIIIVEGAVVCKQCFTQTTGKTLQVRLR